MSVQRQAALGPLDRLVPDPSLPVLRLTAGDILALVAQQIEMAGHRPQLSLEARDVALHGADLMLGAFGVPPSEQDP